MAQRFAELDDLVEFGINHEAIIGLDHDRIDRALDAASAEAAGYLEAAYVLPLKSWGLDLRLHVAAMAAYLVIFGGRGTDPEGPDMILRERRSDALQWLSRVSKGQLLPPDIVDSTPEDYDGGAVVISKPRRGW